MPERSSSPYSLQNMMQALNNNFGLILIAAALLIGGFVIGSLWTENRMLAKGGVGTPTAAAPAAPAAPPEAVPLSDADWEEVMSEGLVIGDENAEVTIVEFTDYQCPFCARHFTDTHPQLKEKYIDTGMVKLIVRDQPLTFHPNAASAAQVVRCAQDQSKGEAMHDTLFEQQATWANLTGDAVMTKYKELATAAGVNANTMESCVTSGTHQQAVNDDAALANRVGAGGTPTFFIEGKPIVGAVPYATFEQEIEALLN